LDFKPRSAIISRYTWHKDHDRDLVAELKAKQPLLEAVFCTNYSYFTYTKADFRANLMQELALQNNVFMFYLNVVGIGDIVKNYIVYDGRSLVYAPNGKLLCEMASFSEDVHIVDTALYKDGDEFATQHSPNNLYNLMPSRKGRGSSKSIPQPLCDIENTVIMRDHNWVKYSRLWDAMLYAQKQIFAQCGIKKAQVHVSGGVDSAIVAVLCAKAMGANNCIFISNPSIHNGDVTKGNAQEISDKLGVELLWAPIQETVDAVMASVDTLKPMSSVPFVVGTAEATVRSAFGLSMANYFGSGIVSTGNHTENVLGWFTFHDIGSIGVYQPIGDLSKLELFNLAAFINAKYDCDYIPKNLYDESTRMQPAAELADSKDDPFDYQIYSGICAELIRSRKLPRDLMRDFDMRKLNEDAFPPTKYFDYYEDRDKFENAVLDAFKRSKRSVYKCAQAAPLLIMSPRSRGFSSRETILNFYSGAD
jgi:NAD+ synthase (glutamine-hydrolysing)